MMPPGPDAVYHVPAAILGATWRLLAAPGRDGFEASTLWIGAPDPVSGSWVIDRVLQPRQTAWKGAGGVCVALDDHALLEVIQSLRLGEVVVARQHTHPAAAYHSEVDDLNLAIGHHGAISVVVPGFALGRASLSTCSVNQLEPDGWRELSAQETVERFLIT